MDRGSGYYQPDPQDYRRRPAGHSVEFSDNAFQGRDRAQTHAAPQEYRRSQHIRQTTTTSGFGSSHPSLQRQHTLETVESLGQQQMDQLEYQIRLRENRIHELEEYNQELEEWVANSGEPAVNRVHKLEAELEEERFQNMDKSERLLQTSRGLNLQVATLTGENDLLQKQITELTTAQFELGYKTDMLDAAQEGSRRIQEEYVKSLEQVEKYKELMAKQTDTLRQLSGTVASLNNSKSNQEQQIQQLTRDLQQAKLETKQANELSADLDDEAIILKEENDELIKRLQQIEDMNLELHQEVQDASMNLIATINNEAPTERMPPSWKLLTEKSASISSGLDLHDEMGGARRHTRTRSDRSIGSVPSSPRRRRSSRGSFSSETYGRINAANQAQMFEKIKNIFDEFSAQLVSEVNERFSQKRPSIEESRRHTGAGTSLLTDDENGVSTEVLDTIRDTVVSAMENAGDRSPRFDVDPTMFADLPQQLSNMVADKMADLTISMNEQIERTVNQAISGVENKIESATASQAASVHRIVTDAIGSLELPDFSTRQPSIASLGPPSPIAAMIDDGAISSIQTAVGEVIDAGIGRKVETDLLTIQRTLTLEFQALHDKIERSAQGGGMIGGAGAALGAQLMDDFKASEMSELRGELDHLRKKYDSLLAENAELISTLQGDTVSKMKTMFALNVEIDNLKAHILYLERLLEDGSGGVRLNVQPVMNVALGGAAAVANAVVGGRSRDLPHRDDVDDVDVYGYERRYGYGVEQDASNEVGNRGSQGVLSSVANTLKYGVASLFIPGPGGVSA